MNTYLNTIYLNTDLFAFQFFPLRAFLFSLYWLLPASHVCHNVENSNFCYFLLN